MFHKGGNGRPKGFGFEGFVLETKKPDKEVPPANRNTFAVPGSATGPVHVVNKHGYTPMSAISHNAMFATMGVPRKRPKNEEEYFDEEEDEEQQSSRTFSDLEYIPAPGSPALDRDQNGSKSNSESEEDPLDAYMAGIENEVTKGQVVKSGKNKDKGIRDDIEAEDNEESYYRYMEENPNAGVLQDEDSDGEIEYDEDGNPIAPQKSRYIDPLVPIDHSTIQYSEFEKNFYEAPEDIANLNIIEVEELRNKLGIKVSGADPPKPVTSFAHFGFDENLIKAIRKSDYTQPTPIQAQGVPIALNGRDIIGIAKTGSGKTAAFIWPMLVHIMDQKELEAGEGPVGLILAPTRELSQQIYTEAKRFGKVYNINVVCCYGGGSKWEQSKALEEGAEIVVATPGRMIDMIKVKSTNLQRVTFLVLDEADRMFDMGFEPQVRSICDHVRPDRQTLLFSATFKKKVERLARDILTDPVRVVQGDVGEANEDVIQIVLVMPVGPAKWVWLTNRLVEFTSIGSVLLFVTKKANSEELVTNLRVKDFQVGLLHGDLDQTERNKVITAFKKKEFPILVATDVAARGLDIQHVKTVINYDVARDIDTHTHRIGRTGRAGEKGTAYTLVTEKDKEFAGHLVRNLEGANQAVSSDLMDLAMQSSWFRKSRFKGGKGKKMNMGGKGLGFRERPGLGAPIIESAPANVAATFSTYKRRTGPQSDRLSAMKSAFQAQYKQQFLAASAETAMKTSTVDTLPSFDGNIGPENMMMLNTPARSESHMELNARASSAQKESQSRSRKKSRWDS